MGIMGVRVHRPILEHRICRSSETRGSEPLNDTPHDTLHDTPHDVVLFPRKSAGPKKVPMRPPNRRYRYICVVQTFWLPPGSISGASHMCSVLPIWILERFQVGTKQAAGTETSADQLQCSCYNSPSTRVVNMQKYAGIGICDRNPNVSGCNPYK